MKEKEELRNPYLEKQYAAPKRLSRKEREIRKRKRRKAACRRALKAVGFVGLVVTALWLVVSLIVNHGAGRSVGNYCGPGSRGGRDNGGKAGMDSGLSDAERVFQTGGCDW